MNSVKKGAETESQTPGTLQNLCQRFLKSRLGRVLVPGVLLVGLVASLGAAGKVPEKGLAAGAVPTAAAATAADSEAAAAMAMALEEPAARIADSEDAAVRLAGESLSPVEDIASALIPRAYAQDVGSAPRVTMTDSKMAAPVTAAAALEEVPVEAWALRINGDVLGYADSEAGLEAVLEELPAPWINDHTLNYGFVEDVEITKEEVPQKDVAKADAIRNILAAPLVEESVYTVQSGDTFSGIASSVGMTVSELSALNPEVDVDHIYVGDELLCRQAVPYISVETVETQTSRVTIPCEVQYVKTSELYEDQSRTEEGKEGLKIETVEITRVNGVEQSRTVVASEPLEDMTPTIVYQGTAKRARVWISSTIANHSTASTRGTFIWPVEGLITSVFGNNSYGWHNGLDIACPQGTPIQASGDGVVIKAQDADSYGLLVVVDHGNGIVTYYAHCSKILVSVGQTVSTGDIVGLVGMTGHATGNHCHYEVRVNGTRVDPMDWLV